MQTSPDITQQLRYRRSGANRILRKSKLRIGLRVNNHTRTQTGVRLTSRHQHAGTCSPQQDRPAVCAIAQQYSSASFLSLSFPKKCGLSFKKANV